MIRESIVFQQQTRLAQRSPAEAGPIVWSFFAGGAEGGLFTEKRALRNLTRENQ